MHLLSLGTACPKVLTATHFHDLFHAELLSPSLPISFVHMEILLWSSSGHILDETHMADSGSREGQYAPGESITFLYR